MTAQDKNEREIPSFLRDARRDADGDDTILPILRQLNRTESAKPRGVQSALIVEPLDLSQPRRKRSLVLPLLACTSVSAALGLGLALFVSGWFNSGSVAEPTKPVAEAAKPDVNPRPVHTVSIKAETPKAEERIASAAQPSPAPQTVADTQKPETITQPAKAEAPAQPTLGAKELLTVWATMPSDLPSQASAAPAAATPENTPPPAKTAAASADNEPHAAKPAHRRHVAHAQRRHQTTRTARAANAPTEEASAAAPQDTTAQTPNPLQTALQKIFSGGSDSSPAPSSAFRGQ